MSSTDHSSDAPAPRVFTPEEVQIALNSTLEALEKNQDYRSLDVHARYNMRGMFVSACHILLRPGGEDLLKRAYSQQLKMTDRLPPSRKISHQLSIEATRHFTSKVGIELPDASQRALYDNDSEKTVPKPNNSRLLELVRNFNPERYRMDLEGRMALWVGPDGRVIIGKHDIHNTDSVRISKNVTAAIEEIAETLKSMDGTERRAMREQLATMVETKCHEWEVERAQNLFGLDDHLGVSIDSLKQWSESLLSTVDQEQAAAQDAMKRAIAEVIQPAKAGRQISPGTRIDPAMAGRIALTLQNLTSSYEHGDRLECFTESKFYMATHGSARTLMNQALQRFCQHLDMPAPGLTANPTGLQR